MCNDSALARCRLSEGCVARSEDREQDLCLLHICRATLLGTFEMIADYTVRPGPTAREVLDRVA